MAKPWRLDAAAVSEAVLRNLRRLDETFITAIKRPIPVITS